MAKRALTLKQERFVQEYLVDLNATQAAVRAGYSQKTASSQGERLLRNVEVQAEIHAARQAISRRTEVNQDRVIRELAAVAFSSRAHYTTDDTGRLVLRDGAPEDADRAVAGVKSRTRVMPGGEGAETVETDYKLWNKVEALRLLGQHLGMFKERVELSGTGANGAIQHEHSGALTSRLDALTEVFARVADRAGPGDMPDDTATEPVDPAEHPCGADTEADRVPVLRGA